MLCIRTRDAPERSHRCWLCAACRVRFLARHDVHVRQLMRRFSGGSRFHATVNSRPAPGRPWPGVSTLGEMCTHNERVERSATADAMRCTHSCESKFNHNSLQRLSVAAPRKRLRHSPPAHRSPSPRVRSSAACAFGLDWAAGRPKL